MQQAGTQQQIGIPAATILDEVVTTIERSAVIGEQQVIVVLLRVHVIELGIERKIAGKEAARAKLQSERHITRIAVVIEVPQTRTKIGRASCRERVCQYV